VFVKHCKESFKVNKNVYVAFVDILKAFDNVNWKVMKKIVKLIKIDYREKNYERVYKHQMTSIRIKKVEGKPQLEKG